MVEDFNITYKSSSFDALSYTAYYINGPECYQNSNYLEAKEELDDFRQRNFMKVGSTSFLMIFVWNILTFNSFLNPIFNLFAFGFQVNVFFESLDVDEVQEKRQYSSIFDFLNTLGGALSLFLGASLISILEIWEVILRIIIAVFC